MRYMQTLIAIAAGYQLVAAIPRPQNGGPTPPVCSLDTRNPTSWAASGGEELVNSFIAEHGERNWLLELDRTFVGGASPISCAIRGDSACTGPTIPCGQQEDPAYHFVLTMAVRVNTVFDVAVEQLQSQTIKDILSIGSIIADFKPKTNTVDPHTQIFQSTAAGLGMADKIVKQVKVLGPVGDMLSFVGGIFSLVAANYKPKASNPDFEALQRDMEEYLQTVFDESGKRLESALAHIFGEGDPNDPILSELLDSASRLGAGNLVSDYDSDISKVLAGGGFLEVNDASVVQPTISAAFEEGFKTIRHGMIGNYLAGLQSLVRRDQTTRQEDCNLEQGKYWDGSACNILMIQDSNRKIELFEEDFIKNFDQYQLSLKTLIKNVIECNNGEVDKNNFQVDGDYPDCYFGLPFADEVNGEMDTDRYCVTTFKNYRDLPDWLFDSDGQFVQGCSDEEIIVIEPHTCLVNSAPRKAWDEAGLRRYRSEFSAENVDLSSICKYFNHDHCGGMSNVQCWEADGGYLVDMSFVKGPLGQKQNDACIKDVRDSFRDQHNCGTG